MSRYSFRSVSGFVTGTPGTSVHTAVPTGAAQSDVLIAAITVQGVAAGSGPYMTSINSGWARLLTQAPVGGSGCGVEIWWAMFGSGATMDFNLTGSFTFGFRGAAYQNAQPATWEGGIANFNTADLMRSSTQGTTGNSPATPAMYAYVDEIAFAVMGNTLNSPGFGSSTGWNKRVDNTISGAFGSGELSMWDSVITTEGNSQVTTTATTSPAGARGAAGIAILRGFDRRIPATTSHPGTL